MLKKIKFIDLSIDVPIIEFCLTNGDKGYALLDTGSEITSFDSEYVRQHKESFQVHPSKHKMNVVGVDSVHEQVILKTNTTIVLSAEEDNLSLPITNAMIFNLSTITENLQHQCKTDISISAILGSDLFVKNGVKIDFENKAMIFNDDLSC